MKSRNLVTLDSANYLVHLPFGRFVPHIRLIGTQVQLICNLHATQGSLARSNTAQPEFIRYTDLRIDKSGEIPVKKCIFCYCFLTHILKAQSEFNVSAIASELC
jgi:hypothetical protein